MSRLTQPSIVFAHGVWANDSSYGRNTHTGDVAAHAVQQASVQQASKAASGPGDAQMPSQTSAELMRGNTQTHEIVDALTAAVLNAEAGLVWLRAEIPDLEKVGGALSSIVDDVRRAGEIVVRLRALMNKAPTTDGTFDP
jgi:hypothetical protein